MPISEASVVIPRPISVVWDYCSAPENLVMYLPGVIDVQAITEGLIAVGTQWRGTTCFLGSSIAWSGEFTRVDLNEVAVFRSTTAPFGFTTTAQFGEVDGGTQLTMRMGTSAGLRGSFGTLADAVVARAYRRALHAGLANLVEVLGTVTISPAMRAVRR